MLESYLTAIGCILAIVALAVYIWEGPMAYPKPPKNWKDERTPAEKDEERRRYLR